MILATALGTMLLQSPSLAEQKSTNAPPTRPGEKPIPPDAFKDEREKVSYSVGLSFGNMIKRGNLDVDVDVVASVIRDVMAGHELKINEQQARQAIVAYQQEAQRKLAEKNKKAGEAFLAENRTKPGVKSQEVTLPDGTKAEMQYKVLTQGSGATPRSNDIVSVNYRGTLIGGKEFDNSAKRGQPLKRPANSLVRGWTEALQMMKVGDKWELYLPSALAYGDRPYGPDIEPGSTLIFEMELVGVEAPPSPGAPGAPPTAPTQPLTSDIIKVPSAEEIKKGAKIEVIKAEDAAKLAKEGAAKSEDKKDSSPKLDDKK
jgi:FKBP-type peptidyl-prolyl cis-trans isomerase FklB